MNDTIRQTANDTRHAKKIIASHKILLESVDTASSESDFEERLTVSSSLRKDYESQEQLIKEERLFANEFISFILNEEFEYGIDTEADAFVRRYSESDFEEKLTVSSSLRKDYESQEQLIEEERLFTNELISFILNEEFEYGIDTEADAFVRRYSESDFEEKLTVSSSLRKDYESQEQLIKEERLFANELISFILNEEFEYGIDTEADALVRRYMEPNPLLTKKWINTIFVENSADVSILIGLLRLIARFDYTEILPEGQTMAVAALLHKNTEVKECGVRAFESWGTIESLKILEDLKVGIRWLQEYIDDVVSDLRKEYNVLTH